MRASSAIFFFSLAASSLAASHLDPRTYVSHQIKSRQTKSRRASSWSLVNDLKGQELVDAFTFSTGAAENGGVATWVSEAEAKSSELIAVATDDTVHIRVDDTKYADARKAVKMISKKSYSNFLMAVDVIWQPQVCGVWPAIWMTSTQTSWPEGGEIDLVEYANQMRTASFSIHTTAGCSMPAPSSGLYNSVQMLSGSNGLNCDAEATSSQGCGMRSNQKDSTGMGANTHGGGKYVVKQDSTGVQMWFFPRASLPKDLSSGTPNPSSWKTPDFDAPSSSCSPSFFSAQSLIINTNLGGTWAEGIWNEATTYAGQVGGSCASMTGYDTAASYIQNEGQDFIHAYWKLGGIKVWQ